MYISTIQRRHSSRSTKKYMKLEKCQGHASPAPGQKPIWLLLLLLDNNRMVVAENRPAEEEPPPQPDTYVDAAF